MIVETTSSKNHPAISSDRWHVVRAQLAGERSGRPRFSRSIVSEHDDRAAAVTAAKAIFLSIAPDMEKLPRDERDQILVRKPEFKSLKIARRVKRRRR